MKKDTLRGQVPPPKELSDETTENKPLTFDAARIVPSLKKQESLLQAHTQNESEPKCHMLTGKCPLYKKAQEE